MTLELLDSSGLWTGVSDRETGASRKKTGQGWQDLVGKLEEAARGMTGERADGRSAALHEVMDGGEAVAFPLVIEGVFWGGVVAWAGSTRTKIGDDPVAVEELLRLLCSELEAFKGEMDSRERRWDRARGKASHEFGSIIGQSEPMQELFRTLDKVVASDSTVLIQGENGTGKELVAREIHRNSARRGQPLIVQNCSSLNDNLLDSELFGHKKGAFTGAVADKRGLFEAADGGTFFLDEVGEMSPALQVKLLRVLQEGTFLPVGGTEVRQVDVRVVAATNRDLWGMVEAGSFREDLYYRLNVMDVRVPPLRERKEDIPVLADHFLKQHAGGRQVGAKRLSQSCVQRMMGYEWPGNVRELENEVERMVALAGSEAVIEESLLSPRIRQGSRESVARMATRRGSMPEAVEALEKAMIYEALRRTRWNKTRAARDLDISRRNLIRKVKRYKLDRREGSRTDWRQG